MSKVVETTKKIVGTWAEIIGPEFFKPYMKDLQMTISEKKNNVFEEFFAPKDYFEVFKKTPVDKLKAIVVVDTPEFNPNLLCEIEKDMYEGLNLDLTTHTDYDWLLAQGVMIFPRSLSWGLDGGHKEWHLFTDEVLYHITYHKNVVIATNHTALWLFLRALGGGHILLTETPAWKTIDKFSSEKICWTPNPELY